MSKRAGLVVVGVLAVAGTAAAIAAVGEREHAAGERVAQMMGERGGDGMGLGGRGGMRGEGRDGMGMGRPGMRGGDGEHGGRSWRGRGRQLSKDEFDARVRERFARIDKNGDGALDRPEIEAHVGQMGAGGRRGGDQQAGTSGPIGGMMGQRLLRRFDASNDGKLTRDELVAGVKREFARFDLDGDGRITDTDLPPIMRGQGVLKGQGGAGRGMGPGGAMIGRLRDADANNDGIVTVDEVLAAAARRFDQFDRNKDGIVDQADGDQLRKEMADYRVQRFLARFGAKDGRVTREQFAAVAAEQFRMLDANNDGRADRQDRGGMRGQGPDRGR